MASHAYCAEVDPIAPGDAILHAAPMSHGSGSTSWPMSRALGVNVVPESGGFDPDEIFGLIARWPRASMFAAPTMVTRLLERAAADCDAARIRTMIYGGAPMYVEDTLEALERFGPRLAQIYGQGERPMTITTLSSRTSPTATSALAGAAGVGRPAVCAASR